MNSATATPTYSRTTRAEHPVIAHDEPPAPQKWSLVVHLDRGCGTTTLLKVMSTLHVRHAHISHMQFRQAPDGGGVLTIECSTLVAHIETVRKSIERAVHVVSATAHPAPPPQDGRFPHDPPGGSRPE